MTLNGTSGVVTPNAIQIGNSTTATQNFVFASNGDGTAKISRGNVGATTQDVLTVSSSGLVLIPATPGSIIQMQTFAVDAGGSTINGALTSMSASSKTITPRSTNSILLVTCYFYAQSEIYAGVNTVAYSQLMESGTGVGATYSVQVATNSGGNRTSAPAAIAVRLTNASLSPRAFTLGAYTNNANSAATATAQNFVITEVQA